MLEADTEYGKPFCIFFFKEPDHVMNIMVPWMTLDDMEGANMNRNYKGMGGDSLVKIFKYRKPFGLLFFYHHQVDYHNNTCHSPISVERTRDTKFWTDPKF